MRADANIVYYVVHYVKEVDYCPMGNEDLVKGFKQDIGIIRLLFFDKLLWQLRRPSGKLF